MQLYNGKALHSVTVLPLLPHWEQFLGVREHADPDGVFVNDYLRRLLGVGGAPSRRTNGGFTTRASSS